MLDAKLWRHFDFWLLGAVLLLCIFGIAMIRSATITNETLADSANRQGIFLAIGVVIVLVFSFIDYRFYSAATTSIYLLLIVLLIIVLGVAVATFGAARWIPLGIINLQPSELGKFLIILTLSHYAATHSHEIEKFSFVLRTLMHVGVPVGLIILQPDLSSCILYGVIWLTLMWAIGLRWRHLAVLAAVAGVAGVVGILFALQSDAYAYIAQRVLVFAFPDVNSQEFQDAAYNINQALISVGSGGLTGQGYGQGSQVQLRFLKVRHTDFIFAAVGNEFGFVGAFLIVLLFAFLIFRIYRAGQLARDPFGRLICYGVGTVIMFEAFSNMASTLNLLPVTGSPLPFVSYGGSSLWTFLIGIGLVQSVILRQKQIEF